MLSVCIIVKNEEKNIKKCLKCLKKYGFEVIVVDTGSEDHTKDIALRYTSKVYDFRWCNDFAMAKNYAIEKATNNIVLVIDSDEFIEKIDLLELSELLKQNSEKVGRLRRCNVFSRKGIKQERYEWINRLFDKRIYHYEGRIHEQVVRKDGREFDTYEVPIEIEHVGYDLTLEQRKTKAKRNADLLKDELHFLRKEGDTKGKIPYVLYQLGKCYYMSCDYDKACEFFSQGLSYDLNPNLEYVIDMVETYGYALINSGQVEEALSFEKIYNEFGNNADFKFLMGFIYMNNSYFEKAIEEFLKATEYNDCRTKGVNSYLAYYNIGVIYECLDNKILARKYYLKSKEYEPAQKRLNLI